MEWFYAKGSEQLGPISAAELVSKVQSGELTPESLVWKEGMKEWVAFSTVVELNSAIAPAAPAQEAPPQGQVGPVPGQVTAGPEPRSAAQPVTSAAPTEQIPNYLWQAIAVTVLCCVPGGIAAIIYASRVNDLLARGDVAGAREASGKAKLWVNISAGSFLLIMVVYVILVLIVGPENLE